MDYCCQNGSALDVAVSIHNNPATSTKLIGTGKLLVVRSGTETTREGKCHERRVAMSTFLEIRCALDPIHFQQCFRKSSSTYACRLTGTGLRFLDPRYCKRPAAYSFYRWTGLVFHQPDGMLRAVVQKLLNSRVRLALPKESDFSVQPLCSLCLRGCCIE